MSAGVTHERRSELLDGSAMGRADFMRAYGEHPDDTAFELVEGIVQMASPVHSDHQRREKLISRLLDRYELATPGVEYLCEQTLHLGDDTTLEPDVFVRTLPEYGGACRDTSDGFLAGPPELVIEVAGSSLVHDLNRKRRIYARHGVREYLVVDLAGRRFRWFDLTTDAELTVGADGVCRLRSLPGCWLATGAVLDDDFAAALPVLQAGLASADHPAFVEELARRRALPPAPRTA